jgi:hypothetical protein
MDKISAENMPDCSACRPLFLLLSERYNDSEFFGLEKLKSIIFWI